MSFKVLVLPELFDRLPSHIRENMRSALNELREPFPGTGRGSKKEIRGADDVAYRLRVGDYRVFYD